MESTLIYSSLGLTVNRYQFQQRVINPNTLSCNGGNPPSIEEVLSVDKKTYWCYEQCVIDSVNTTVYALKHIF
ncbi:MAG TPA: hypothetical protein DCY03_11215 [Planctomycetaceae bacterium]|nr:hypothetical protein [Planctomycetaceae bacterium]